MVVFSLNKNHVIIIILMLFVLIVLFYFTFQNNNSTDDIYNWTYNKNEYPKSEYRLDELPVSHKSGYEVRQFFEDSDLDNDGILRDTEINIFDYKIKHSQYTFNGPYGYN